MSKFALVVMFLLFFQSFAVSQDYAVDKGAVIISGMASFSSMGIEDESDRNTIISLIPTLNYFFAPNFFLGGTIEFTRMSYDGDSSTSLGIGPNVGYAFGRANSTMFPYLIAGFHYKRSMSEGHRTFGADAIVGGGIVAPIKQHLGIVIEACYHIMDSKLVDANESTSSNAFIVGIGFAGLLF